MEINKARGFHKMFESIDYMHWMWKNYRVAWQGQLQDKNKNWNIILKAITDRSLWIWHAFFGLSRANKNTNVLNCSPLIA